MSLVEAWKIHKPRVYSCPGGWFVDLYSPMLGAYQMVGPHVAHSLAIEKVDTAWQTAVAIEKTFTDVIAAVASVKENSHPSPR